MSKKRTESARRRRDTASDGKRDRADAPRRKKTTQPSAPRPRPSSSGSGPRPPRPSSGGGLPLGGGGKPNMKLIGILILIGICYVGYMLISGGFSGSGSLPIADAPISQPPVSDSSDFAEPTADTSSFSTSSEEFIPPPASKEGQTWLIMLYQDADDKILEKDIYLDLNEAEKIGSTDRVHIVAQVDRFNAGYRGDGDWASTKRFYITQDNSLQQVRSQQIEDIGEANMADGDTLVDFVTWAADTFPADKYVLIMSDHGIGWPGGWSDPNPGGRDNSTPLSAALGDQLYLNELDDALATIRARTGIQQFELIGMDACLMAHIEVFSALSPHARYAVASQETEPALGWAYTGFLDELTRNPDMTGADLGRAIVDTYISEDQRIVDDTQRADMLRGGSPLGGLFSLLGGGGGGATMSAAQLAQQMGQNVTITAVDLAALPNLMSDFNNLAVALQNENQRMVAEARTYAQSFTSVFGGNVPPSYIDLGNFVQLIKRESGTASVTSAVDAVWASLGQTVIAEKHGPKKPGATGISIYFPNSQLYRTPATGMESYTAIANRFAQESLWDDYLAYHYTGRQIDPATSAVVVPDRGTPIDAPGAGQITVSNFAASDSAAAPGQPIVLSADIGDGENIGYVYLFVGFVDQASNSVFLADADYLESDNIREMNGLYYPDWGEGEFTLEFEWEPIVFAIDDGVNSVVARFTPQSYGAAPEDAVYTVDGIYTYADGGETRYARLYFQDGLLRQAFGFTGEGGTGAPREIHPQSGDTFTVLEQWLDLDANGRVSESATQEGGALTFSDE
ncbi:MAG: hypothetical protein GY803_16955, partial [Chloroflexi bacterium]|nr:hypothetical protein [Chloroflexota bacterium]